MMSRDMKLPIFQVLGRELSLPRVLKSCACTSILIMPSGINHCKKVVLDVLLSFNDQELASNIAISFCVPLAIADGLDLR
jgi:hypothetical protein